MKTKMTLILLILFSIIGSVSCKKQNQPINDNKVNLDKENYEVVLLPKEENSEIVDVLLKNNETGEIKTFITLGDIVQGHYHNTEYHNGELFILRKVNEEVGSGSDNEISLWVYKEDGKGVKLLSGRGLDFRANPDGSLIATYSGEEVLFIDDNGDVLLLFGLPDIAGENEQLLNAAIGLEGWSADGSIFWGNLFLGAYKAAFYQVNVVEGALKTYDLTGIELIGREYDLNEDTGKLVFSDYPVFFDALSSDNFKESGKTVTLYLLDLESMETQQIAQSQAEVFLPSWMDEITIAYENPNGEGRLTYTLP